MSADDSSRVEYRRRKKFRSKRTGEEKIIIDIVLSVDAYKKLQEIAQRLFPDLIRGRISYTIEHMIKTFAVMYTHNNTRPVNPRPSTQELAKAIQEQIRFEHGTIAPDIPHRVLRQYIMFVRGIKTPRHADAWAYKMYIEGIIKPRRGEKAIRPEKIHDEVIWEWVMVL